MSWGRSRDTVDERTSLLSQGPSSPSQSPFSSSSSNPESSGSHTELGQDEENLLDRPKPTPDFSVGPHHWEGQWKKNLVLLLGVFLVNADSAILLAMFRRIASDFDKLSSASWIINSYIIGVLVAQPLYGKLSDIYGRKPLLLMAYFSCCVGGLLGGLGFSFWGILLGRIMVGIGNAGITVLVSTLIVDLVPIREVAVWRSYVYAVNQMGRAVGPPLGGFIADNADWRWSLLYQVPLNILSLIFIWWKMSLPTPPTSREDSSDEAGRESWRSKLRRIDFFGLISLGIANCSLLLFLEQIQQNLDVMHSVVTFVPMSTWIGALMVFIGVEAFWAREPILPLRLLAKRNVLSSYSIQFLQTAAQMAFFTSVPLFFKITMGDSNTGVAIRLLVITLGTILGGLVSGFVIKKTGLYRFVTLASTALSNISFLAIFLRWRGTTGWLETFYGFPVGLGFGVSLSAAFIGLTAGFDPSQVAVSTSGFYLSLNLGSLVGVSGASLLISYFVKSALRERLQGLPDASKIIHDVTSNLDRIGDLPDGVRKTVLNTYTNSFMNVWLFALFCGCLAFLAGLIMREGQLHDDPKGKKPVSRGHGTFEVGVGE